MTSQRISAVINVVVQRSGFYDSESTRLYINTAVHKVLSKQNNHWSVQQHSAASVHCAVPDGEIPFQIFAVDQLEINLISNSSTQ